MAARRSRKRKITRGSSVTLRPRKIVERTPVAHGIGLIMAMLSCHLGRSHHQSESRDEQEDLQAFELIGAMC